MTGVTPARFHGPQPLPASLPPGRVDEVPGGHNPGWGGDPDAPWSGPVLGVVRAAGPEADAGSTTSFRVYNGSYRMPAGSDLLSAVATAQQLVTSHGPIHGLPSTTMSVRQAEDGTYLLGRVGLVTGTYPDTETTAFSLDIDATHGDWSVAPAEHAGLVALVGERYWVDLRGS